MMHAIPIYSLQIQVSRFAILPRLFVGHGSLQQLKTNCEGVLV
jgi:hypothetical protein